MKNQNDAIRVALDTARGIIEGYNLNGFHTHALNKIDIAIRALDDGWQPIESAPRDGSVFLIDAPDVTSEMTMATYENGKLVSVWDGKPFGIHVTPAKYWRQLAAPPITTSQGDE